MSCTRKWLYINFETIRLNYCASVMFNVLGLEVSDIGGAQNHSKILQHAYISGPGIYSGFLPSFSACIPICGSGKLPAIPYMLTYLFRKVKIQRQRIMVVHVAKALRHFCPFFRWSPRESDFFRLTQEGSQGQSWDSNLGLLTPRVVFLLYMLLPVGIRIQQLQEDNTIFSEDIK